MIAGILLLIWGIGITLLAFKIQSDIQEAKDLDSQNARDMYDDHPILFCIVMGLTLIAWPLFLVRLIFKSNTEKGN